MKKLLTLKYAATCRECGTSLPAGSRAKWYGRGRVYGIGCHSPSTGSSASGDGLKWWYGQRVRATHCEDAPCCGCCGPQAEGY